MKKKTLFINSLVLMLCYTLSTNAQWQQANGFYGGTVTCMCASGTTIFLGTDGGGMFLSNNNGTNWTAINNGLTNTTILSLAVSGTTLVTGTYYGGVFISKDGGANWSPSGLTTLIVSALYINGTTIFALTNSGLYISTDTGTTWNVASGLPYQSITSLAGSDSIILAGNHIDFNSNDIYLSTNNGGQWEEVNDTFHAGSFAISGTNIFAGNVNGVFLSNDTGRSWMAVRNGLTDTNITSLAVNGTNICAGTQSGNVFLSLNNGLNWSKIDSGATALLLNGTNIFVENNYGLILSADSGKNWISVNNGIINTSISTLAISGNNLFAGNTDGVFLSIDNGENWTSVNNGLPDTEIISLAAIGTTIFAGTNSNNVFLSNNYGSSWTAADNNFDVDYPIILQSLAANGATILAATYEGLFLSNNNGGIWSATTLTDPVGPIISNGTTIYAFMDGVLYFSNNGIDWTTLNNNSLASNRVTSLAVNGKNIFAGTYYGGIFLSTDSGANWTAVNNGLSSPNLWTLSLTSSGTTIFAGFLNGWSYYPGGVYMSSDSGKTWSSIGLSNFSISTIAVDETTIFAGTEEGGVWSRPLSDIILPVTNFSDNNNGISIYPNPTTNQLTIHTSLLQTNEKVTVSVMNVLGQASNLPPPIWRGNYAMIDVRKLQAGIYFVKVANESMKWNGCFVKE